MSDLITIYIYIKRDTIPTKSFNQTFIAISNAPYALQVLCTDGIPVTKQLLSDVFKYVIVLIVAN